MLKSRLSRAIVGLLVLQFILGMLSNLYAQIPDVRPWEVYDKFGLIPLHAVNGLILLVLAVAYIVRRARTHGPLARPVAGLVNIVVAFICGVIFVDTQNDVFSLLMALAFLGALMAYVFDNDTTSKNR